MNIERNQNSVTANGNTTYHRKRKRRKLKKCVAIVDDFYYRGDAFEKKNSIGWRMGSTWFWTNYRKAVEWQAKHKEALRKSYALGLQLENHILAAELWKEFPDRTFNLSTLSMQNPGKTSLTPHMSMNKTNDLKRNDKMAESHVRNEGIEFEMSEEMMKFFEQSIKHKLEMKRLKEEQWDCITAEVKELQETHDKREKEMKLLYGDGSSMIIGMETAVQLSFDKYCDLKSPKYWPNIPLKL